MAETTDAVMEPPAEDLDLGGSAELEYAGFWSRVAALIVDNAVVTIFGLALLIAAGFIGEGAVVIANFLFLLIAILYWPLMESSERQATIGKQLLGIQVVDANGARLNFVRALLRNLAKIISSLPFGLGFPLAAFTAKKQALHDMITRCLVVQAGPSNFRKAVIAAVGAVVIVIAGVYYYVTEYYLPQMTEEMGRQMGKGMKPAQQRAPVAKPKPVQPPEAKAPAPAAQPAPAAAPGGPKPMTPQEIAEFEKKMQQAQPEPAKVAAVTPPAKPAPSAPQPKPAAPAPAKPAEATAKPAPAKPPALKAKPETKPATVAVPKPKPVPAPVAEAPAARVVEPPAAASAQPIEPRAPAPAVIAPGLSSRVVRSPKYNDVMSCVMFRDAAALAELLGLGWWVDRPDSNGLTPLMAAAWNGDAEMTRLLLKAGADPNRRAPGGSVLDYAGRGENALVIQMLKSGGAR